jgi:hypothetical protein
MGFDDRSCPARVRLLRFRLVKGDLHRPKVLHRGRILNRVFAI